MTNVKNKRMILKCVYNNSITELKVQSPPLPLSTLANPSIEMSSPSLPVTSQGVLCDNVLYLRVT